MRNGIFFCSFALLTAAILSGCTSALYVGYGNDDLYGVHDRVAIANAEARQAEIEKAEAEARQAKYEALMAQMEADNLEDEYYSRSSGDAIDYQSVVEDTYEGAYERRLRGFNSATYRLPSSYYNYRYGSSYTYVSAYDPAVYNVIVMGDEVWVEPKYITAMFGNWGTVVNFSFGVANPWSYYYSPWYYPASWYWYGCSPWWYHSVWDWGWTWNWPCYYSFGSWGPYWGFWPYHHPHYPGGPGFWPGHCPGHNNYAGHNRIYRPAYRTTGNGGGYTSTYRSGTGISRNPGSAAGGSYRTRYTNGNSTNSSSRYEGTYRNNTRGNSSNDNSSNRTGIPSRYRNNNNDTPSRSTYTAPSTSRPSGGGFGGGGRSGGGYGSGGTSSRGR